jgi:3-dehydroquinate synthase
VDRLTIGLDSRSYDIVIGAGLLGAEGVFDGIQSKGFAVVVTNSTVAPFYAEALVAGLRRGGRAVQTIVLPDGETHKTWDTLNLVFDGLLAAGADRRAVLYALGGGVIGDITGFAAACYMRGIGFVQVPTTLLAQVDSSVGGKTGINHPRGKNMIGAFHQPLRVIADLDTLRTLPEREYRAGLAEVIKYGPVADADFLAWTEASLDRLLERNVEALRHAVRRSCEIKAAVVEQDEREAGLRAILNFGHTFGHAIEAGLGFGEWLHGEAVACGMALAADLSASMGLLASADAQRVVRLIDRAGLPTRAPALGAERYLDLMRHDKKSEGGVMRYVLLDRIGHAVSRTADDAQVAAVIDARSAC